MMLSEGGSVDGLRSNPQATSQRHYEFIARLWQGFLSKEFLRSCKSKYFLWALSMTDAQHWSFVLFSAQSIQHSLNMKCDIQEM